MTASFYLGTALFILCVMLRVPLEQHAATHVLVLLPALAISGWLVAFETSMFSRDWNRGGYCTLLVAVFTIVFWMLPRSIDASLTSGYVEIAKYLTVPLGVGVAISKGWGLAHPILKGFLKAQALSMLGFMSFLYLHAPVRICNAYLEGDQKTLGIGFLMVAGVLAIYWAIPLFFPQVGSRYASQPRVAVSR